MIDSHAHLYWPDYDVDFDQVIQRSLDIGLTHIINIGVDVETSKKALGQARGINALKVYSTIGIHPGDYLDSLSTLTDESIHDSLNQLEKLYREAPNKIVAVGECGLDYYSPDPTVVIASEARQSQGKLFQAQVELAKKLNLPLVIHCRDAWNDIFNYVKGLPAGALAKAGVFHCWSGSYDDAKRALDLGFYISFAGNLTFKNAHGLRQIAKQLPLEKILIETDCPFLSPEGKRGQRNEPANVIEVARTIAELKDLSLEEVGRQTAQNAIQLFQTP